ncbi:TetR/AcrR family transcriptional regulator [Nocardiopsis composta]
MVGAMSENQEKQRRRAPAMAVEERREMIVRTALPLIAENGAAVTTAQIARAAGIGEGTVFRAFADKDELMAACVAAALDPEPVLAQIADVSLDQPLTARLVEAAEALRAHLARIGRVVDAIGAAGRRAPAREGEGRPPVDRRAAHDRAHTALAELFAPEAESLRVPPVQAAAVFHMLLLTEARSEDAGIASIDVEQLVEVLLHGVLGGEGSGS